MALNIPAGGSYLGHTSHPLDIQALPLRQACAPCDYVGEQTLAYYGRQSQLVNAQLDVDSYDLATGDSIGTGYGSALSYTSLNATETAQDTKDN